MIPTCSKTPVLKSFFTVSYVYSNKFCVFFVLRSQKIIYGLNLIQKLVKNLFYSVSSTSVIELFVTSEITEMAFVFFNLTSGWGR